MSAFLNSFPVLPTRLPMEPAMTPIEFAKAADPYMWLLTADSLHDQAVDTWTRPSRGDLIKRTSGGKEDRWDVSERATVLLASFALENAIKSYLVYENPSWISGGRLARQLKSHRLVDLRNLSTVIPYRNRYEWVLRFFENGNESWARYPCALSAHETAEMPNLSKAIWDGYCRVMAAYGRKMECLLRAGWQGPHGTGGSWDTTMRHLQLEERSSKAKP